MFWLSVSLSASVYAVDPTLDWETIQSENFFIHFSTGHKEKAERVVSVAEAAHSRLSKELNWMPAEKTHLVISDESDLANGYATPLNFNRSVLFMAPPSGVGGLEDFDDWLSTLITHEYTHILHLDKAHRVPAGLRNIFGRFVLLFPNIFQPAWMVEGLATYKETDNDRSIGRGQSTLFSSMMRAESMNGLKPVSQVNLPINTWPAGNTPYLYGVYFMIFIDETYGEETIQALIEAYSDNLLPFAINSTFKNVFGKDVTEMWLLFSAWLEKRYTEQIQNIKQAGIVDGKPVSPAGYANQPVRVAGQYVYYIHDSGYSQPELVRFNVKQNNAEVETLVEVHHGTDFDVDDDACILLTQNEICDEYALYRDIYIYGENKKLERITRCGRYVRAVWDYDGKSIIALRHKAGEFELHRLSTAGELLNVLWTSGNDTIVSQFDISPDGKQLVAAVWRKNGGWNLEWLNIEAAQWEMITRNTDIQAYPSYADQGESIIYSADYNGVFNLYRYETNTGQHHRISNVINGAFQSSQSDEHDALYYVFYTAEGTEIRQLDKIDSIEIVQPAHNQKLIPYDYEISQHGSSPYSPWSGLRPRWWFPHLVLTEDGNEAGFTTSGNDALGIHNYQLTAAYEIDSKMLLGSLVYSYSNRFSFIVARSNNILLDTSGNFNRTRPTDTVQAVISFPYTQLLSSHKFLLAVAWERDSDKKLSATATPVADFEDNLVGLGWLYNSSRSYPFSISENDGMKIRLVAEDSDTFDSDFSGQVYTLDWKQYIRTGDESVLALRFVQGWGTDFPSLFELGGENGGSLNLLGESGVPVFGVRNYALRGYAEGRPQLRGRRAQLLSAEWRFPIQRVERGLMAPPIGLMQWSGTVFVDSGDAYNRDSADKYYTGTGLEINADLNLFYMLPVSARLGYAHGFDENIGDDRLYLSVGASF